MNIYIYIHVFFSSRPASLSYHGGIYSQTRFSKRGKRKKEKTVTLDAPHQNVEVVLLSLIDFRDVLDIIMTIENAFEFLFKKAETYVPLSVGKG